MKLKVEGRTTEAGFRILTTPCPGPMTCKVGSTACSRCSFHQKRDGDYVYCSFGRKQRKSCGDCESLATTPQLTRPDVLFCGQTGREVKASDKCKLETKP